LGKTINGSGRGHQIELVRLERDAGASLGCARQSPLEVDHLIGQDRRIRIGVEDGGQRLIVFVFHLMLMREALDSIRRRRRLFSGRAGAARPKA
jgi:hypothetical protein